MAKTNIDLDYIIGLPSLENTEKRVSQISVSRHSVLIKDLHGRAPIEHVDSASAKRCWPKQYTSPSALFTCAPLP